MSSGFYTSRYRSPTSTITLNQQTFDQTEFDRYIAERGRQNAKWLEAAGIQTINFNYYTPPSNVTTIFPCTPSLNGRLYPSPASPDIFVLDFLDIHGTRVLDDTGLTVYDVGAVGCEERTAIDRAGSTRDRRGTVDFFMLNPGRVVEVVDNRNRMLKRISFNYTDRSTAVPVFV